MNPGAANIIVQGFLKGAFDVFDGLYNTSFAYNTLDMHDLSERQLAGLISDHDVALSADVTGGGMFVVLYAMDDVASFLAVMEGDDPATRGPLNSRELAIFQEISDSHLRGGASNLTEKFGTRIELKNMEVLSAVPGVAADLFGQLGDSIATTFHFKGEPHFSGEGVLLYSASLDGRIPSDLVRSVFGDEEGGAMDSQSVVSEMEMHDILSGFSADHGDIGAGGMSGANAGPENLDVVMDIELVATARLGEVEMPLADVLRLGPGSVLEVGHVVNEPVDLLVNNKLVARGEVVIVDDKFALRITEVVSKSQRIQSLG